MNGETEPNGLMRHERIRAVALQLVGDKQQSVTRGLSDFLRCPAGVACTRKIENHKGAVLV